MAEGRIWHLHTAQGTMGPYTAEELRAWHAEKRIDGATMVWREGLGEWTALAAAGILNGSPVEASAPAPAAAPASEAPAWAKTPLEFRKQVLKLLGKGFRAYDASGRLVLYCEQKAFKLKEDLRVYADEEKTKELLRIAARQVLDVSATYDVRDAVSGVKVGAFRRHGMLSLFVRDQWSILDNEDREIGLVQEDSTLLALVRRFLVNLIPQKYTYSLGGKEVATFQQAFNPFHFKGTLNVTGAIDPRLAIAATTLLLCIEGRQG